MRYFAILIAVCLFLGCRKNCSESSTAPGCIFAKIDVLRNQPKGNPAYSVYEYLYKGKKVYYFPPQCCDQYSDLYDENCNLICHPDGGITGTGDGNCQDFLTTRTNEVLIWKDGR